MLFLNIKSGLFIIRLFFPTKTTHRFVTVYSLDIIILEFHSSLITE
jgi:hypothetical protein